MYGGRNFCLCLAAALNFGFLLSVSASLALLFMLAGLSANLIELAHGRFHVLFFCNVTIK